MKAKYLGQAAIALTYRKEKQYEIQSRKEDKSS